MWCLLTKLGMLHPTLTLRWGCLIAECPEEVNLALILWPVVACIVLIPLLLLCVFICIRNRRDAAEFARFMKEKDKARWESVSTLLKVFSFCWAFVLWGFSVWVFVLWIFSFLQGFCFLVVFSPFLLGFPSLVFSSSVSSGLLFFGFFPLFWVFVLCFLPFLLGFCSLGPPPTPTPPHTPLSSGPLFFGCVFSLSSWLLFFGFFSFFWAFVL